MHRSSTTVPFQMRPSPSPMPAIPKTPIPVVAAAGIFDITTPVMAAEIASDDAPALAIARPGEAAAALAPGPPPRRAPPRTADESAAGGLGRRDPSSSRRRRRSGRGPPAGGVGGGAFRTRAASPPSPPSFRNRSPARRGGRCAFARVVCLALVVRRVAVRPAIVFTAAVPSSTIRPPKQASGWVDGGSVASSCNFSFLSSPSPPPKLLVLRLGNTLKERARRSDEFGSRNPRAAATTPSLRAMACDFHSLRFLPCDGAMTIHHRRHYGECRPRPAGNMV